MVTKPLQTPSPLRDLSIEIEAALRPHLGPSRIDRRILVALSGGPDSTALLWALVHLSRPHRLTISAAHLDHGEDPGSPRRARLAARSAARLGVPFHSARRPVTQERRRGESHEEAARRIRYVYLRQVARSTGSRWIALAHHRDDQAETFLLRLLGGSGLRGLAAMRPRHHDLLRPMLGIPASLVRRAAEATGLAPTHDPGNRDLRRHRNRVRHLLLPRLERHEGDLRSRLASVSRRMQRIDATIRDLLMDLLALRGRDGGGAALLRAPYETLPPTLRSWALAMASELAGLPLPPGRGVRRELERQLRGGEAVGVAHGDGWHWTTRGNQIYLEATATATADFAYTLEAPGQVAVHEAGCRVRVTPAEPQAWMLQGESRRTGFTLPEGPIPHITVRNRRPGDRIRPLGAPGSRRLKEVLIDGGVARHRRNRLPLLCVDGEIAWVPGVTIAESFRVRAGRQTWLAELLPESPPESGTPRSC